MKYSYITCKTALHQIRKSAKPYHYDLNIYRGCEHKCQYCFAMYTHQYLNNNHYFDEVFIKENIAEVLDQELAKKKTQEVINIGGVCDSYQPIEKKTQLMRKVLKVCIQHKTPIIISTKSTLILRDLDLIKQLASLTAVNIAFTVTFMDEHIRKCVEPNTSPCKERMDALAIIKKETDAIVGVHIMPIVPYLNDSLQNLEAIYKRAESIGADYVLPGTLYLRGHTRQQFFSMIDASFPQLKKPLWDLYTYGDKKTYKQELYKTINILKKQYHANHNYHKPLQDKLKQTDYVQLSLF